MFKPTIFRVVTQCFMTNFWAWGVPYKQFLELFEVLPSMSLE